jgi:ABC-type multidrug transport system ATPase subunit/pSer/pThr/pTyr-binding forkhead associated (FHA) protein/ABC-type multidrug transport system permease subunit
VSTAVLRISSEAGQVIVPTGQPRFIIGRARNADYVIADSRVSRQHLMIEETPVGWAVRDVSSNGTWLGGQRMLQTVEIHGETTFRLGTPTGPEVTILTEFPAQRSAYDFGGDADMQTMLPNQAGYTPPRAAGANRPTRPTRGDDYNYQDGRSGGRQDDDFAHSEVSGHTRLDREHERSKTYPLRQGTMTIGRGRDNDITITDLLASRHHAQVSVRGSNVDLVDLDSANGSFLNGRRVNRGPVRQGDVIAVGHHVFQLEGNQLVEYVDSGDVSFEADGLNVWAPGGGRQLMHDMTFRLPGRALLGVVGPSGAGKSTLLNALTGFKPADKGTVRYAGRDLYDEYDELRRRIGYVPQDDILHTSLTVRKALELGAELRFPPDVTPTERRARIDEVLAELGLTQHANTVVSRLSGGQRKRTSVALELLTRPTLLYLDEPTSGLDPGMDLNVMESLRKLADDGRTVIVVTHSVLQLDLCDYVLVLAPGGYVAYFGPPQDALPFFGENNYPRVFRSLEATPGPESAANFRQSRHYVPSAVTAPSARPAPEELPSIRQQSVVKQLLTLSRRTFAVIASDKGYLRLSMALPLVLGAIPRAINGNFKDTGDPFSPNSDAPTIFLIMVLCACFMGMSNSIREIVKEREIYRRERAIGLSRGAYVGSKVLVLAVISLLQTIPFTLIALIGRLPPDPLISSTLLECMFAVFVTIFASAMVGLAISAAVDNADKTMPLMVVVTMIQLVFSAGIVPVSGKPGLQQVAVVSPARWGYAAMAADADFNKILRAGVKRPDKKDQFINPRAPSNDALFFHTKKQYVTDVGLGLVDGLVFIGITSWMLRRMDPKTNKKRKAAAASA